ncbi:uncharacterized protein METZ01_LOCUS245589, partial [marine metagenome]
VPIVVARNGEGPTVLLSSGNHGNEYEGQIILRNLISTLDAKKIRGRLIVLPGLNAPAVRAGRRVSPLDGGNLNRLFPGSTNNGPTSAIAGFVTQHLLPLCEFGLDFHSGDPSSCYLPCAFLTTCSDSSLHEQNVAAAEVFGADHTYVVEGWSAKPSFDANAHRLGVSFISTELGGGGGTTPETLSVGKRGLDRVLDWLGVMPASHLVPCASTTFLDGMHPESCVTAPADGIFEPCVALGEQVVDGQIAGYIHIAWEPGLTREVLFQSSGIVAVMRRTASVKAGNYLFTVTPELDRKAVLRMSGRIDPT